MAPFEALYGRRCRTPLSWDEVGDRQLFGPDLIKESEQKVKLIRDRLKVAQSRQKSYADSKRKEIVYEAGDRVYLRVSPRRGFKHFGVKGKLAPRFVGPYKVWNTWEKLLISWNCLRDCREFTTCSTFPSWRSATQRWLIYRWEIQCHWKQFIWIVIWPTKRNHWRFSILPAESHAARLSSFAKFSGATISRRKRPGSKKKTSARTTQTFLLTNPNLEGEIHLKGGRFVTSQIFNLECYTLDHHWIP